MPIDARTEPRRADVPGLPAVRVGRSDRSTQARSVRSGGFGRSLEPHAVRAPTSSWEDRTEACQRCTAYLGAVSTAPKRSRISVRAEHAELAFGSRATELGWIWHPVLAGRDLGIDARIELVSAGSVTSDEFTVQVKSGFNVDAAGKVHVAGIKLSTIAYWHRKFPPTLVVALDPDVRRFAFAWAHNAIGRGTALERLAAGQKTVSLTLSRLFDLDDQEPWQEIERYARLYFESVRNSLARTSMRGVYIMLYMHVCDVIDLLVDWIGWIAYADPSNVVDRFVDRSDAEYGAAAASFAMLRIAPGDDDAWRASVAEPVWAIGALAELHRGFAQAGQSEGILEDEGPLELMVRDAQTFLASTHQEMMTMPIPLPSGHVMAMGVAPAIAYGVGLVLVSLRDWARLLRGLLFEPPEDAEVKVRLPGGNADRLHTLASMAIRSAPEWVGGEARASGPAWNR